MHKASIRASHGSFAELPRRSLCAAETAPLNAPPQHNPTITASTSPPQLSPITSCLHENFIKSFKMVYTLTVHMYANDKPDSIERIKAKLIEAARIYRKDKETIDWFVMQDVHDPKAFTVVERFEKESVSDMI
jgi:hypothetical protein